MRKLVLFVCLAVAGVSGCAGVTALLPSVIAAVTDGLMVLDTIKNYADRYFSRHTDTPALQAQIDAALTRARLALDAALRATHGAEKLTQHDVDLAFKEFRDAYMSLLLLVGPIGVSNAADGALRATPDGLQVPAPLALTAGR
jgi:uncharacterized membrane protein